MLPLYQLCKLYPFLVILDKENNDLPQGEHAYYIAFQLLEW